MLIAKVNKINVLMEGADPL